MKQYKLDNVIKKTDNEVKANKLLQQGFLEVNEKGVVVKKQLPKDSEKLEEELKQAKAEIEELKALINKADEDAETEKKPKEEVKKAETKKG